MRDFWGGPAHGTGASTDGGRVNEAPRVAGRTPARITTRRPSVLEKGRVDGGDLGRQERVHGKQERLELGRGHLARLDGAAAASGLEHEREGGTAVVRAALELRELVTPGDAGLGVVREVVAGRLVAAGRVVERKAGGPVEAQVHLFALELDSKQYPLQNTIKN